MEDILASIRRIIADDQESAKATEPAPPPRPRAVEPPEEDEDPVEDEPVEEDILDLADVAEPAPKAPPTLEMEHEEISFRDEEPDEIDFDSLEVEPDPEPDFEPAFEPEPQAASVSYDPPEPLYAETGGDRLLSAATDATVSGAFNMLAHTVLTNNGRTLDDLVREMLRPMLKVWLDDNLPVIVERLVRAEIERVSRGGR